MCNITTLGVILLCMCYYYTRSCLTLSLYVIPAHAINSVDPKVISYIMDGKTAPVKEDCTSQGRALCTT